MYKAIDIAYWFLAQNDMKQTENNSGEDGYEGLTNMKIQKLLYFAQGIYFTFKNEKLFSEKIYAWDHGPVVRQVYNEFKEFGREYINYKEDKKFNATIIEKIEHDKKVRDVLVDIFDCLNRYTAWQLRNISHDPNGPWFKVFNNKKYDVIPLDDFLTDYFRSLFELE